jgi:hypothetical protein
VQEDAILDPGKLAKADLAEEQSDAVKMMVQLIESAYGFLLRAAKEIKEPRMC